MDERRGRMVEAGDLFSLAGMVPAAAFREVGQRSPVGCKGSGGASPQNARVLWACAPRDRGGGGAGGAALLLKDFFLAVGAEPTSCAGGKSKCLS